MKKFISTGKVVRVERLNNSCYGNPNYKIWLLIEDDKLIVGKTAANSKLGYLCTSHWEREVKTFVHHYTRNDNCIFDELIEEGK